MRRYVKGTRFWEISFDRETFVLEMSEGTIGKPGKPARQRFRTYQKAAAEYDRLLGLKVRAKWQPGQPAEPTEPAPVKPSIA